MANYIGVHTGTSISADMSWIHNYETLERAPIQIDATTVDAGNTTHRTTFLRPGLCLGRVTATGRYKEYAPAATDGTETVKAILYSGVDMLDPFGVALTLPVHAVGIIEGHIDATKLILVDAAAKVDLRAAGFTLTEDF